MAVLRSSISGATLPSTIASEATFTAIGNYMITNGNGARPHAALFFLSLPPIFPLGSSDPSARAPEACDRQF